MKNKLPFAALIAILFIQFSYAQWNPREGWKDSYKANGFCWCDTNFDHNLDRKSAKINGRSYKVTQICKELEKHPDYRKFRNGDIPYNDIQCGNGPVNDAPDEAGCPGRVDIGSRGCNIIGPKWDMRWLSSRSIFGGNGNNDDDNDGPSGDIVSFKSNNNRFISSEDGRKAMTAKRNRAGRWEKFEMSSQGRNTYAFKGSNGKFMSSEDGRKGMTASRSRVGAWEKFQLISQGGNSFALRGSNGRYVTRGSGDVLFCTARSIGSKEKFNMGNNLRLTGLSTELASDVIESGYGVSLYPNPVKSLDASIKIAISEDSYVDINIFDLAGKVISSKNMGVVKDGTKTVALSELNNIDNLEAGLYILNVNINGDTISKKLIIQ